MSKVSRKQKDEARAARPKGVDVANPMPLDVDGATMVFGGETDLLLPPHDGLPEAFKQDRDPWCDVVQGWFFSGLKDEGLTAKPGVDKTKALRHCSTIMRSFAPKHEHKIRGVAFLMSKWFEPYATPSEGVEK